MARWPTTLPAPLTPGYGIDPMDQSVSTDMEVGSARVRRRTRARNDAIDVAWRFTDAQMAVFRAWFDDDAIGAAGGAAWFTANFPMGDGGVVAREARFKEIWKSKLHQGLCWHVTGKLVVRGGDLTADQRRGVIEGMVYGGVYPSLFLDFATDKALDSRITFTRATTATYFDAAGVMQTAAADAARFDHDPVTGESLGLLIEEARTNLLLNSATLATQDVTVTAVAHTLTFWGTGTVTLSGASTAGPLVGTGDGDRVDLTFTPTAGTLTLTVTGSCTKGQLEAGAAPSSYIPTTGSTVTRNADVATMTGTNFSSWFNAADGTFVASFRFGDDVLSGRIFQVSDGTTANSMGVFSSSGSVGPYFQIYDGGVTQATLTDGSAVANTDYTIACSYESNLIASSWGGRSPVTDTSASIPTVNTLSIGRDSGGASLNGHINRLIYYPSRLVNADLESITA